MKKIINFFKSTVQKFINFIKVLYGVLTGRAKKAVAGTAGEAYVDTAVKIIIVVVLGLALLAALTLIFKDNIIPGIEEKISSIFDYEASMS